MIVTYYAQAVDWCGCTTETLPLRRPATVRTALKRLASRHGACFRDRIYAPAPDRVSADCFILLNNQHVMRLQGLDTPVTDADHLAIASRVEAG
jgi:molybdopterin converting factor small subunit